MNTFGAYVTGRRNFKLRWVMAVARPVALLASVPIAVYAGATLEETLLCFVGSSLVAVLLAAAIVRVGYGRISLRLDLGRVRRLVGGCWPFVVLEALQVAQFKIDTLMVFWLLSSKAAAQYETAYRLLEVGRLAIRPLAAIAFPVLALLVARRQWGEARDYGAKILLRRRQRPERGLDRAANPGWIMTIDLGPGLRRERRHPADPVAQCAVGLRQPGRGADGHRYWARSAVDAAHGLGHGFQCRDQRDRDSRGGEPKGRPG